LKQSACIWFTAALGPASIFKAVLDDFCPTAKSVRRQSGKAELITGRTVPRKHQEDDIQGLNLCLRMGRKTDQILTTGQSPNHFINCRSHKNHENHLDKPVGLYYL